MQNKNSANQRKYCVYIYYGMMMSTLYVGKTTNFVKRHSQHRKDKYFKRIRFVGQRFYFSEADMNLAAVYYIGLLNPRYNVESRSFLPFQKVRVTDAVEETVLRIEEVGREV